MENLTSLKFDHGNTINREINIDKNNHTLHVHAFVQNRDK